MLIAVLPHQRSALAIVAFVAGIAACWLTRTPLGLLPPVAAMFLYVRGRAVPLLHAILGIAFAGAVLAAFLYAADTRDLALSWAAFFAAALSIGAIVASVSAAHNGSAAQAAIRGTTREGAPSPANQPLDDIAGAVIEKKTAADATSSLSLIHPDDRDAATHAAARAFWTGVPQVTRYRRRQADGNYRWTETRSEPGYSVSVDIDDLVTEREPPPPTASNPLDENEAEVMRSARVVVSLFGNGWAFDAAGRWIYLHPFAQNSLGVTLEDLNAPLKEGHTAWKRVLHPDDYDQIAAAWRHCLQTGDHFNVEFRFRRASGAYIWARTAARPSRDSHGRITGWFGIALDIDVYKKTVEALRNRERELSQLIDMVPSQIWRLTPDGEPIFFNKRMIDFLGLDVAEMDKRDTSRLEALIATIHPDDAAAFRDALNRCLVTGEGFASRYRLRRADGVYRWMSSRAEPMRDQGGRIVEWYGLCHDIDDQMHAEEALRRSERQLQQLIDAVPALIWTTTREGTPTYLNKRYTDVTGATLADLFAPDGSPTPLSVVHPDDIAAATRVRSSAFAAGAPYIVQYRQIRRDGTYRWTETRAEALRDDSGNILQWYGVSVDINDLVTAQEALRKRERELQQLVDALPVHIWSWTPAGQLAYVNKRSLEDLGLSKANLEDCARVAQELVHPEDAPGVLRASVSCLETGDAFKMRYRRRWKDGNYRWIEGRCEPLRDRDGTIVHWYQVSIDIDDQVRAQAALRESERSLRALIETAPARSWCTAPDGEPTYFSRQFREFHGFDEAFRPSLSGILSATVHPDDLEEVSSLFAQCLVTGEPYMVRNRQRRFDGAYRWTLTRAIAMRNADGTIVQWNGICLDIDGEVRAQEELRVAQETLARASQAASLSELSASIAHEVNQPLAAIVANSHACQRWLKGDPPNLERARITVERIIRDANSAADVVSRIRALFKQSVEPRHYTAFDGAIAEARNLMAEEAVRRHVRMDIDVDSTLPLMAFDRVQIQQVLINLIRNGFEAMDSVTGEKVLGMRVRRIGDVVQTEISDRGGGIESPEKIFEPFFTTKEHGMGMGLAICRSIVEAHGGRLWAEKNEPQGATFVFTLPVDMKTAP